MSWKIIITLLSLYLTGCAATTPVINHSKTIDEYLNNTATKNNAGEIIYDQYVMKAALIAEIIENTVWPDNTKNNITFCIIGDDDFKGRLENTANIIKQNTNTSWKIKRGIRESDVQYCDVLFAGYFYTDRELRGYLNRASGHPILTIGDDKYFAYHGGMIAFNRPDSGQPSKLTIDINVKKIQEAGLHLKEEVIELAKHSKN